MLVVVSSTDRRGAEIEGMSLAAELSERGLGSTAVALVRGDARSPLELDVLGSRPFGRETLQALRRRGKAVGLVVAYGSRTLPACALALTGSSTPFVYRSIGDPTAWAGGRLRRVRTAAALRRARHVVALSASAAGAIHHLYGIAPASVSVAPNARDDAEYVPATDAQRRDARAVLGVEPAQRVVSLIGALTREKRPVLAVEAVAELSGVVLLVAGDGPCRTDVEHAARRSGGICHVLGVVPDVRQLLHASDVVVSTSSTEGMPGSLIEATLSGVPVVATDVGFVADVVGPGGVLVPPDAGPRDVATAVRAVLDDAVDLGRLGRQHAKASLSWDAVAPTWLNVLTAVSRGHEVSPHYRCQL